MRGRTPAVCGVCEYAYEGVSVSVSVSVSVGAWVRACARGCVRACVRAHACVHLSPALAAVHSTTVAHTTPHHNTPDPGVDLLAIERRIEETPHHTTTHTTHHHNTPDPGVDLLAIERRMEELVKLEEEVGVHSGGWLGSKWSRHTCMCARL